MRPSGPAPPGSGRRLSGHRPVGIRQGGCLLHERALSLKGVPPLGFFPPLTAFSSPSVTGSFISTSSGPAALTCIPARLSNVIVVTCRSVTLPWYLHVASFRSIVDLLLSIYFLLQYVMCQRNNTCFLNGSSPRTSSGVKQPISILTISATISSASII